MKKSRKKVSPKKSPGRGAAIPGRHGGTLFAGAGNGPPKGTPMAGRPPNLFKQALRELGDRQAVLAHVDRVLVEGPLREEPEQWTNPATGQVETRTVTKGSRQFEWAMEFVIEHGYGKATQPLEHDVGGTLADILTKIANGETP